MEVQFSFAAVEVLSVFHCVIRISKRKPDFKICHLTRYFCFRSVQVSLSAEAANYFRWFWYCTFVAGVHKSKYIGHGGQELCSYSTWCWCSLRNAYTPHILRLTSLLNHYFSQCSLKFNLIRYRISLASNYYHFLSVCISGSRSLQVRGQVLFLTFPDEDLSVGAVVQDEAVITNQQLLSEQALLRHFGHSHGTCRIRHLRSKCWQVWFKNKTKQNRCEW